MFQLMKKILAIVCLVVAMAAGSAMPAQAQFHFGIKAGMNVDRLSFNKEIMNSDNRAGFTGGIMAEFTVPLIGVGCDLSAMYVRRNSRFMKETKTVNNQRDYIDIPLNLKYKLSLPGISKVFAPFVTTGPSVAFLTSKKYIEQAYKNHSVDVAWNFGLGFELLRHVQIAASYGLGLTKALDTVNLIDGAKIDGKNRYWTVTAAYLF